MNEIVVFALKQRVLVVVALLLVVAGGIVGFINLNIEAYPDPVPPLVDVIAQSPGQSAAEIERSVSEPIEAAMSGLPHLAALRTVSLFGLSDIKPQFTYNVSYAEAEQMVTNVLSQIA